MPLTSANRVYKAFPDIFAENVNDHIRRRTEIYRKCSRDLLLQNIDEDELSMVTTNNDDEEKEDDKAISEKKTTHHSRLTPELKRLRTRRISANKSCINESDSENSSSATPNSTPGATPRSRASPSPRGHPVNIIESPRPLSGGNSVPVFTISPRRPRVSPRTVCSLDTVDLWEESDSESDMKGDFDSVDGVVLNPSKTIDLADLRRSQSPIRCKRNKMAMNEKLSGTLDKREIKPGTKSRARMNRRLRVLFPKSAKPEICKPTSLHLNPATKSPTHLEHSNNDKLLSQRRTRLAAKFSNPSSGSETQSATQLLETDFKTLKTESSNSRDFENPYTESFNSKACPVLVNGNHTSIKVKDSKPIDHTQHVRSGNNAMSSKYSDILVKPDVSKPELHTLNKIKEKSSKDSSNGSPKSRRVKFNSFVTVRKDEENTLDYLKRSTDTARVFKNKYLQQHSGTGNRVDKMAHTIH